MKILYTYIAYIDEPKLSTDQIFLQWHCIYLLELSVSMEMCSNVLYTFYNKVQLHIYTEVVITPYYTWKITQGKTKYTLGTVFFINFSKIIFKKHDIYFKVLNVYYVSATYNLKDGINISLRHFYSFFSMGWQHCDLSGVCPYVVNMEILLTF